MVLIAFHKSSYQRGFLVVVLRKYSVVVPRERFMKESKALHIPEKTKNRTFIGCSTESSVNDIEDQIVEVDSGVSGIEGNKEQPNEEPKNGKSWYERLKKFFFGWIR